MTRTNAVNFTAPLQFPMADAGTDIFLKEDVQTLAKAVDLHDHSNGKGLVVSVANVPDGALNGSKLTDNTVTSAKIADGTIATADLAAGAVTNIKLAADTARANLLTNGGFEIWQRGNGPFVAGQPYFADRWLNEHTPTDNNSISKDTVNIDSAFGSLASAACTFTKGTGLSRVTQTVRANDSYQLANRTLTFSIRVRTSTPNAVRPELYNGSTYIAGAYHTGDGTWQTLSITVTMVAGTTVGQVAVRFDASCTAYLDNAMLVVGSVAADYAPLHPADDLARCLRYYEKFADGTNYGTLCQNYQATKAYMPWRFRVLKPVNPTVTVVVPTGLGVLAPNGAASYPTTAVAVGGSDVGEAWVDMTVGTAGLTVGATSMVAANGGGNILVEANP